MLLLLLLCQEIRGVKYEEQKQERELLPDEAKLGILPGEDLFTVEHGSVCAEKEDDDVVVQVKCVGYVCMRSEEKKGERGRGVSSSWSSNHPLYFISFSRHETDIDGN